MVAEFDFEARQKVRSERRHKINASKMTQIWS